MDAVSFLLALGSTLRITRFLTKDTLAAPLRAQVIRRTGPDSRWTELSTCPWCLSIYVATATVCAAWWAGGSAWFQIPALVLTTSYLVGIAGRWID